MMIYNVQAYPKSIAGLLVVQVALPKYKIRKVNNYSKNKLTHNIT